MVHSSKALLIKTSTTTGLPQQLKSVYIKYLPTFHRLIVVQLGDMVPSAWRSPYRILEKAKSQEIVTEVVCTERTACI